MAQYKLLSAPVITPVYPSGQDYFLVSDDVQLHVSATIDRSEADHDWQVNFYFYDNDVLMTQKNGNTYWVDPEIVLTNEGSSNHVANFTVNFGPQSAGTHSINVKVTGVN